MKLKYSIIVPVYNVERYISRCIDSILKQTIQDFELILIDDGSPDNSGNICDEYAQLDNRIVVVHQENKGVSAARNKGLDIAKGKYIVFVDSDDEVTSDYLECMDNSDADLVISGVKKIGSNGKVQHCLAYSTLYINDIENSTISKMISDKSINFIYAKRYKKKIIDLENISFPNDMELAEDTLFCAKYTCACQTIEYVDAVSYVYYKYNVGTLSSFDSQFMLKMEIANKRILKVLSEKFPDISKSIEWQNRCWNYFYYSIFYILREWDVSIKKKAKVLQQIFNAKEYRKFEKDLDIFMKDDSKTIRNMLKLRNAYLVLIFWKLLEFRRKITNEKT